MKHHFSFQKQLLSINRCCLMFSSSATETSYNFDKVMPQKRKMKAAFSWMNKFNQLKMTSILEAQTAAVSVRHKEKASQETNMRKLSEAYLSCVRAFWLQPAEGCKSASTGSFWKFICWFQCLRWSQSQICWRMLSAGGCVLLWLVPWTAFVAEAHCTCTYRWRGRRGGSTREKRVG